MSPIIIGEIIFPKKIPNLNQSLFNGVKIIEFKSPKIKNIKEIITDHNLKPKSLINGYKPISKKNMKNTIPKLLLELNFISFMRFTLPR